MKHKLIITLLIASAFIFTGCYDDEVKDLEKKIKRLEKIVGTTEPILARFSTTNTAGQPVIKNTAYYFKASWATSYMVDDGGTYIIRVERAADVKWESNARFDFMYDPITGEATGATCRANFLTNDGREVVANFTPAVLLGNTVDVSIQYFDIETRQISLTVHAATTADSENNEYPGKPMTLDLNFSGKLDEMTGGGE